MASFAEPGSPFNKVAGLGFAGVPSAAELEDIERAYAARGAPTQVELAHLVDPAIAALLTERGYRLESFGTCSGAPSTSEPEPVTPPGIEIRRSGDDEFDRWLARRGRRRRRTRYPGRALARGVPPRDVRGGRARLRRGRRRALRRAARRRLRRRGRAAHHRRHRPDGRCGTAPAHRRRGIQSALLAARLIDATPPGATSPSSPRSRGPSPSRTPSVEASTCSTPAPYWSSTAGRTYDDIRPARDGPAGLRQHPARFHNTAALRTAAELEIPGVVATLWERLRDVPAFVPEDEAEAPDAVRRAAAPADQADAVVFCTPEYAGTLPGASRTRSTGWSAAGSSTASRWRRSTSAAPAGHRRRGDAGRRSSATSTPR